MNVVSRYHERMKPKQRLSASVDAALIDAVEDEVARGRAPTVSAWVSDALALKLERDRRLAALAEFVAAYERDHGVLTEDELRAAKRRARAKAVPVRGARPTRSARSSGRTR